MVQVGFHGSRWVFIIPGGFSCFQVSVSLFQVGFLGFQVGFS